MKQPKKSESPRADQSKQGLPNETTTETIGEVSMSKSIAGSQEASIKNDVDTFTMEQRYLDMVGAEALEAMRHDLFLEVDRVLSVFDDIHPDKVARALHSYADDYLAEHKRWDRWTSPDFYELTEGLDQLRRPEDEGMTLQDILGESSAATQRTFVDLCARDLETFGELTLARRADFALMVLAQESELDEVSSKVFAKLESLGGRIAVSSLTLEGTSHLAIEPQGVDLTSSQARDLAAALVRAADILDGECE